MQSRSLADLLAATFGVATSHRENPITNSVGASKVKILNASPTRVGLVIVNTGATNITIAPNAQVALTTGIIMGAGASMTLKWDQDFELLSQEWTAIGNGAGGTLYILETYITPRPEKEYSE